MIRRDGNYEMKNHKKSDSKSAHVAIAVPSIKLFKDLKEVKTALELFEIPYKITIVAAHWAPKKTLRFISELERNGIEVIIAAADGSAHLPGMIASLTTLPVIGVPLRNNSLDGMDSLLSIVQMPKGVPVGTMGVNSAFNAGIYACQLLSLKYDFLKEKLRKHKDMLEKSVEFEDKKLNKR